MSAPVVLITGALTGAFVRQQALPNAQLVICPDANHGSIYQYPELFVEHANLFSTHRSTRQVAPRLWIACHSHPPTASGCPRIN